MFIFPFFDAALLYVLSIIVLIVKNDCEEKHKKSKIIALFGNIFPVFKTKEDVLDTPNQ